MPQPLGQMVLPMWQCSAQDFGRFAEVLPVTAFVAPKARLQGRGTKEGGERGGKR